MSEAVLISIAALGTFYNLPTAYIAHAKGTIGKQDSITLPSMEKLECETLLLDLSPVMKQS